MAVAYWTSSGTGTGTATVGTETAWLVEETGDLAAANLPTLRPDEVEGTGSIQTHEYTVTNEDDSATQQLAQVDISIKTSTGGVWSVPSATDGPSCTAADFSVGGELPGVTHQDNSLAGSILAGDSDSATVTVQMIDNGANQDACKNASVPLHFSVS